MTKERFDYPKPVATRSGGRVRWQYYRTEAEAEIASAEARREAKLISSWGYDFGFCCPGSITKIDEGEYAGLHEVCLP